MSRLYLRRVRRTFLSASMLASYFNGQLKLVIDKNIASLPRRQTDEAIIIRSQDSDEGKARVFKLNATTSSDPILLERFLRNAISWSALLTKLAS